VNKKQVKAALKAAAATVAARDAAEAEARKRAADDAALDANTPDATDATDTPDEPKVDGKRKREPKPKAEPKPKPVLVCLCGCGATTSGGSFRPGHDARWHGVLQRLSDGRATLASLEPTVRANVEARCALVDGRPTLDHDGKPFVAAQPKAAEPTRKARLLRALDAAAAALGSGLVDVALVEVANARALVDATA
jgi:hypothetical protein